MPGIRKIQIRESIMQSIRFSLDFEGEINKMEASAFINRPQASSNIIIYLF